MVKNLPAMQETWVRSLGQEDPLGKEMAIHSSILAWRIPWTEGPGGLQSRGHKESDTTKQLSYIVNCREKMCLHFTIRYKPYGLIFHTRRLKLSLHEL